MWQWYAVFCKPRQDERAEMHLANQGFETFRPKARIGRRRRGQVRTRIESMFPRYLFIHLNDTTHNWAPIHSTRGAVGLVRVGHRIPCVPKEVIVSLQDRADDRGVVDLSAGVEFRENDEVEITDGPFAGHHALYQANTGEERVIVLMNLLQGPQELELPRQAIRNVERP